MKKTVLEVQNLTKYYGNTLGVENLSLKLKEGEIFGFIGPNGAGKSTTIRSIVNLINKTKGKVLIDNEEYTKNNLNIKEKIGYLPSEINLYGDLTVKQMLDFHESFYKKNIHSRRVELVKKFELDEKKKIDTLSLGNLKKLGIVLAFMHEPKILILDEPTSGLDPIMQDVFYNLLKEEKNKGNTIFYSTHILNEVSKICDTVGIIKDGKLIKAEKIEEIYNKSLALVTIISPQIKEIIKDLKINPIIVDSNTLKFSNTLSPTDLIKKLSKYKLDKILIEEALERCLNLQYEEYAQKLNRSQSKTFLLIREKDNKIIGSINVRWNLTEEMKKFGGNIGYCIRPTERKKGYNKINLYLGLIEAQILGLQKVMLDCDVNNIASSKTMESLGGILERTEIDPYDGILTSIYWIDVPQSINKYKEEYQKYIK